MKNLLILLFCAFPRQEVAVRNNLEGPLPAGHPVSLKIAPDQRPAFITHRGKTIPSHLFEGNTLWFCTEEEIAGGKTDTRYALHSGESNALRGKKIFDLLEDFSGEAQPFHENTAIPLVRKNGRLLISKFPGGHTTLSPARLSFHLEKFPQNFALSLDLECTKRKTGYARYGIEVLFRRTEKLPEKVKRKIAALVAQLGSNSWNEREGATHELVRIGTPAVKPLNDALKSEDAEVRWRAGHALREIQSGGSWPGIMAGFEIDHAEIGPVAFTWRIGRTTNRMRHVPRGPIRVHLELRRDQDGYVTISWNGRKPTLPVEMKGEVEGIHLYGFQSVPGSAALSVDNILLRRYLDEDARPTVTIQPRSKK